ncbi:MAG: DUF2232 domain-containing protein [Acidobacteriota bacterium]
MTGPAPAEPQPALRRLGPGAAGFLSLLVFLGLPLIPLLGAAVAILAPLPLAHLAASGRPSVLGWGWVAVGLGGLALATREEWTMVLCAGYLLVTAWPAQAAEMWLRRPWSSGRWAAIVALVTLTASAGLLVAFSWPGAPADILGARFTAAMNEAGDLARILGGSGMGGQELVVRAASTAAYLAPAMVALYVLAVALWLRPRLAALGFPRGADAFRDYTSEEWLPVGFVLGGAGWVFTGGTLKWLSANLLVTTLGLYFVAGLAIVFFYLGRRVGGSIWVRLGVALLAMQLPVAIVVSVLGLADAFFPLRRSSAADGGQQT